VIFALAVKVGFRKKLQHFLQVAERIGKSFQGQNPGSNPGGDASLFGGSSLESQAIGPVCEGRVLLAVRACIAYTYCMQYTIRGIPAVVDHAIRERARAAGKSLNETVVDALAEGAGVAGTLRKRRDLGDIAGTWKADKAIESALAAQDRVDEDLWR
jgi:hypothetical protein